jgi:hypothetical protein
VSVEIAYVVKVSEHNEELRYSLRSLANVPHGEVTIVGYCPSWVTGVRHLPVEQDGDKFTNIARQLDVLGQYGPDEFALFNDDFFCMSPVAGMPPVEHRGGLLDLARSANRGGQYGAMLRRTAAVLMAVGYPDPLAYTLHKPMIMNRRLLRAALEFRHVDPSLSWRSMYGNLAELGGTFVEDVKVHGPDPLPVGAWWSTNDGSFRYHKVGAAIRRAFPEPSQYER